MSDGLNTIDPTVAKRWIGEYEKKEEYKLSVQGRHRQEIGEIKQDLDKIVDAAEKAGVPTKYFLDELFERKQLRKVEQRKTGDNEDDREMRKQLKDALGGLPLGDWGVAQIGSGPKSAQNVVPDTLTLAEATEILAKPKGRGKPSKASITLRAMAEKVVAEHASEPEVTQYGDGLAGAMADAIEAHEAESKPADEDVRDLRPAFLQ